MNDNLMVFPNTSVGGIVGSNIKIQSLVKALQ